MKDMGMTDAQWKDNLRYQLDDWKDVKDVADCCSQEDVKKALLKIANKNIKRIEKGLED